MTIAIVGLGYVGLPLALQFARNGVAVIGLDVDTAKVSAVNEAGVTSSTSRARQ
jgi:UDP-N-acetyl-D-mannosaminuronate dehydrogenase